MNSVQDLEVSCYLQLYDNCKSKIQNTIEYLKQIISKQKWYRDWNWDICEDNGSIYVYGFHRENILVIPGYPATRWEPADPIELDGFAEEDEVLYDIKTFLKEADNVEDIEWLDINIDDEEDVLDNI